MSSTEARANAVREMFSSIAHRYDFLNRLLSFRQDVRWRKKAVASLGPLSGRTFLDIACGTGDLSIAIAEAGGESASVVGGDFSPEMVEIGLQKVETKNLAGRVRLERADALSLPYPDNSFDGVTCAFGVRNFADLDRGLKEMARVIKPGGRMVILEFTTPTSPLMAFFYRLYFTRVLPAIGGVVSGKRSAYEYLPDSVYKFPSPPELAEKIKSAGMASVSFAPLTFGICGIHSGTKP